MPLYGEAKREYARKWIAQRRAEYFKGKSCVKCGSTEELQLDHIDRKTKVTHKIWSWSEARRLEELDKCQVLCYPCHKEKTRIDINATGVVHGLSGTYDVYKCRCPACRAAHAARARRYRNGIRQVSSDGRASD